MGSIYNTKNIYSVEEAIKQSFINSPFKWLECDRIKMWHYYHLETTCEEIALKAIELGYNAFYNELSEEYYISKCSALEIIEEMKQEGTLELKSGETFKLLPVTGCKCEGVTIMEY